LSVCLSVSADFVVTIKQQMSTAIDRWIRFLKT